MPFDSRRLAATPPAGADRIALRRRRRAAAVGASLAAHAVTLLLLSRAILSPPTPEAPPPLRLGLAAAAPVPAPRPVTAAAPAQDAAPPAPTSPAVPPPARAGPEPVRRAVAPAPVIAADPAEVGEAELVGAAVAGRGGGSGEGQGDGRDAGGGGACDMAARVQAALRRDPLVRAAAAAARARGARTLRVWNGDWVQGGGEDGKGLAAVREAIVWEVAFAPAACRSRPMRGLVLLGLDAGDPRAGGEPAGDEGAGAALRFVVGDEAWRWSDLVTARGAPPASR